MQLPNLAVGDQSKYTVKGKVAKLLVHTASNQKSTVSYGAWLCLARAGNSGLPSRV